MGFKVYEVNVLATLTMVVEAETEDDAQMLAFEQADFDCAGYKETTECVELIGEENIKRAERHADQVIYI